MKPLFVLFLFYLNCVFILPHAHSQPISIQLQVGEEKTLSERLGNCIPAASYQVYPNLPDPIIFKSSKVSTSTFGVYASITLAASFEASPGTYNGNVIFEVFEFGGSLCLTDTIYIEVEIIPALKPIPDFETFPRVIVEGGTVNFENLTQNPVETWYWDFGNGKTSPDKSPETTYDSPGIYSVSLTATGPGGTATTTKTDYIEVVESGTPGQSIWTFPGEGYVSTPAIGMDGTIYVGANGKLLAVDWMGEEKWISDLRLYRPVVGKSGTIYGTNGDVMVSVDNAGNKKWVFTANDNITDGIFSLGLDETSYVGTRGGELMAIDSSGKEKWTLDLEASTVFNPIIGTDGTIYTLASYGADKKLFAVSPSGKVKWFFERDFFSFDPEDLSISNTGNIVVSGKPLMVFNPEGTIIWESSYRTDSQIVFDTAGNMYGTLDLFSKKLYSFEPKAGKLNWELDLEPYLPVSRNDLSDPLISADGKIYCYSKAGIVFSVSPTGELLWKHALVPDGFEPNVSIFDETPAMDSRGILYIGYDDEQLHAISTDSPGLLNDTWSKKGQNSQNTRTFQCPFPNLLLPADGTEKEDIAVAFSWRPVAFAETYEIQISKNISFSEDVISQLVADTAFQLLTALDNESRYYWRVRPLLESEESGCWSAIYTFTTVIAPPAQAVLTAPADGSEGIPLEITFSWATSAGAATYQIQIARDGNFLNLEIDQSNLVDPNFDFTLSGYETTYYWRIKAVNDGGESDWSDVWTFTTALMTDLQELASKYELRVQPNPTREVLFIEFDNPFYSDAHIVIYDSAGNLLNSFQKKMASGKTSLQLSVVNLPAGNYFFQIILEKITLQGKFIKIGRG